MQISNRIYLRSNGTMVFWRFGRLGGSFYYSRNAGGTDRNADKRIAHYKNMDRLRDGVNEARVWKRRAAMAVKLLDRAIAE
jgi:hypothetical protein